MKKINEVLFKNLKNDSNTCITDISQGVSISYQDLIAKVLALSNTIRQYISEGELILVVSDKSINTIAIYFAILECNGNYAPLNSDNPDHRVQNIISESEINKIFILEDYFKQFLFGDKYEILNDSVLPGFVLIQRKKAIQPVMDQDRAIVLFTSGSTGAPKGIILSHKNVAEFILWASQEFANKIQITLSVASFQFDLSILDLYVTFNVRGLLIIDERRKLFIPSELCQTIFNQKVSTLYMTPSMLRLLNTFSSFNSTQFPDLKILLLAGEQLYYSDVYNISMSNNDLEIYNLYGPTESNVCCAYKIQQKVNKKIPVPIGKVIGNFKYFLESNNGKIKQEGILHIAGPGLFEKYINRKETHEFHTKNGIQYYNTGDVVILKKGLLSYKGRIDMMVKRNGYRIELNEIEKMISAIEGIAAAAVISKQINNQTHIIAFIVFLNARISEVDLKLKLSAYLPKYMLPDAFYILDKMPLNENLKVDNSILKKIIKDI